VSILRFYVSAWQGPHRVPPSGERSSGGGVCVSRPQGFVEGSVAASNAVARAAACIFGLLSVCRCWRCLFSSGKTMQCKSPGRLCSCMGGGVGRGVTRSCAPPCVTYGGCNWCALCAPFAGVNDQGLDCLGGLCVGVHTLMAHGMSC
jgi:hypothetical protein